MQLVNPIKSLKFNIPKWFSIWNLNLINRLYSLFTWEGEEEFFLLILFSHVRKLTQLLFTTVYWFWNTCSTILTTSPWLSLSISSVFTSGIEINERVPHLFLIHSFFNPLKRQAFLFFYYFFYYFFIFFF